MTKPLFDYYGQTDRLHKVDGTGTPEEVFNQIEEIVKRESYQAGESTGMSEE